MIFALDDQDFVYEGPSWPPVKRECGGWLTHIPKVGRSRYSDFYQGLARFAVEEHNKKTAEDDAKLELVRICNLNERIDDHVYWYFFRLEAKSNDTVATYRVAVTYLADTHRQLILFKLEGNSSEKLKKPSDEKQLKLEQYVKELESRFNEDIQKMKENEVQMKDELSSLRDNHSQLLAEFAILKSEMNTRCIGATTVSVKQETTSRKISDPASPPPGKKARC